MTILRSAAALIKPISSTAIACSALAGYLGTGVHRHTPPADTLTDLVGLFLGTFFLAAAGSIINQILEADLDARHGRTRHRPIATGALSTRAATVIAALFTASGLVALFSVGPGSVPLLGLFGLAWYTCVYTPLKRRTPLAIFPGTVVGMVPPALGWLAGSCPPPAPLVALFAVMGFGQLAHVGLQLLIYSEDSRNSPLPNLYKLLGASRLLRFTDLMTLFTCGAAATCFLVSDQSLSRILPGTQPQLASSGRSMAAPLLSGSPLLHTTLWALAGFGALLLFACRSRLSSSDDRPALERQFLVLNLWIGILLAAFAAGGA